MEFQKIFLESNDAAHNLALLMIRVFIGICFIVHALGKLGVVGPGNMQGFQSWLESMNIPYARIQARMAMGCEMLGGILLSLGLFTRVGAVLCISVMVVAAIIGHRGGGYLITNNPPGNEYTINLAAVCTLILLMGPGRHSLDYFLFSV